jgi:hypothetical protein
MSLAQPDSTLTAIQQKIRRLTASPSEQSLTTDTINQAINTFYQQDFPYAIKLDQLRSVYTFFTAPNVDIYPMNVNFNQGIRAPVYFEGISGMLFKDRGQFFNMWPRWPTLSQVSSGILSGNIIIALQSNPCQISSLNHGLTTGESITIVNVQGMTNLNGNTYNVTVINQDNFYLTGIDATAYPAQVPNTGNWFTDSGVIAFTVSTTPFLRNEVVIGGTDTSGNVIRINDDGYGILNYIHQNGIVPQPPLPNNLPGMENNNLSGQIFYPNSSTNLYQAYPGDQIKTNVGSVDYVTGAININFSALNNIFPASGSQLTVWVSQYAAGRPYTLLWWNNYFQVRPVPDRVYKVEVETYLTPIQLLENGDFPILNQWWQYLSYGAAMEIQRERNDFEGVEGLREGFMRQEALVLERQGVEEIGQRNATIFSSTMPQQGWSQGMGWPY